jgi:hypothetical protein
MIRSRALATNRWSVCILTVILALSFLTPAARAQIGGGRAVPADVKTAGTIDPNNKTAIQKFVNDTVQQLAAPAADVSSKARDALIGETRLNDAKGQNTATAAYLDFYAQCVNSALTNLVKNPDARIRLNAAIVTAGVAREAGPIANSVQLVPLIMTLLQDKSQAVVLWGVKASGPTILAQLKGALVGAPNLQLIQAVIAAVKANPKGLIGGAIAFDAYDALAGNIPLSRSQPAPNLVKALIGPMQDLMTWRLTLFVKGVPPEPRAERIGANFLCSPWVWPQETPAQQMTTLQLLSDLLNLAAAQAQQANPGDFTDLIGTINSAAKSMSITINDAGIQAALKPLTGNLTAVPKATLVTQTAAVTEAIKKIGNFAALKPPPALQGHEAAPAPASAPTTNSIAIPGTSTPTPVAAAPAGGAAEPAAATRPATTHPAGTHPPATPPKAPNGTATPSGGAAKPPTPAGAATPNTPKR